MSRPSDMALPHLGKGVTPRTPKQSQTWSPKDWSMLSLAQNYRVQMRTPSQYHFSPISTAKIYKKYTAMLLASLEKQSDK